MSNISIKLNLTQLKNLRKEITRKDGSKVDCLIMPIDENKMHKGEKGVYLNLTAMKIKNKVGDSKDTHLIKQNFSKEVYEAMSEEEKKAVPIIGNAISWERQESEPVSSEIIDEDIDADLHF